MQYDSLQIERRSNQPQRTRAIQVRKLGLALLLCSCVTPAFAQSANFRAVDSNSDRKLSQDELETSFGASGAAQLLRQSDHNQDGQLTIFELRQDRDSGAHSYSDDRETDDDDRDDDDGDGDSEGDD